MVKEGERMFLECLDQLEVSRAKLEDVSKTSQTSFQNWIFMFQELILTQFSDRTGLTGFCPLQAQKRDCNHIFLHFVPPILLDPHRVSV